MIDQGPVQFPGLGVGEALTEGGGVTLPDAEKFAVTCRQALMTRVQDAVPEQSCDQPAKAEPAAGVAVSVTVEPWM